MHLVSPSGKYTFLHWPSCTVLLWDQFGDHAHDDGKNGSKEKDPTSASILHSI